jgi:hypothetical protein
MALEAKPKVHQCECDICRAGSDSETTGHHQQMNLFLSRLNEPQRRWYVGLLSQRAESPCDRQLALITGLDEKTIRRGRRELEAELTDVPQDRQRREGGGRPRAEKKTPS